jgi:hypothetical protein
VLVGVHCILYDSFVTGLYAVTMVPGWEYQARRTLSANAQLVSLVATALVPEGHMVIVSALAGEAMAISVAAAAPASREAATVAAAKVRRMDMMVGSSYQQEDTAQHRGRCHEFQYPADSRPPEVI